MTRQLPGLVTDSWCRRRIPAIFSIVHRRIFLSSIVRLRCWYNRSPITHVRHRCPSSGISFLMLGSRATPTAFHLRYACHCLPVPPSPSCTMSSNFISGAVKSDDSELEYEYDSTQTRQMVPDFRRKLKKSRMDGWRRSRWQRRRRGWKERRWRRRGRKIRRSRRASLRWRRCLLVD